LWHGVYFEKNYSAVVYQGAIKDLLYDYKYRGRRSVVYTLFDLLRRIYARERLLQQTDGMTFVPLHAGRLQERGFNQAEELARMLAKWANKPLLHGLIRQTATGKLSKMGRWERLASMQGAFHAGKRTAFTRWTWLGREMTVFSDHAIWKGRRILLIDDVYTTGGTVNDCARELLATGASSVRVLTIARAV
jgi:predicted amidophosphoribosyltransferase